MEWKCMKTFRMDGSTNSVAFTKGRTYKELNRKAYGKDKVDIRLTNDKGNTHTMDLHKSMIPNFEEVKPSVPEYEPVPGMTLSLFDAIDDSDASVAELKHLDSTIHSWGYGLMDQIPIDKRFFDYASKSTCFIAYLLDTGKIREKQEEFKPYTITIHVNDKLVSNTLYCMSKMLYGQSMLAYKGTCDMLAKDTDVNRVRSTLREQLKINNADKVFKSEDVKGRHCSYKV